MPQSDSRRRVLIAITDASPMASLWRTALTVLGSEDAEVVAIYLADDRWLRAASLPFTREFSLLGGGFKDFTRQRAEQLNRESLARIRRGIERLASEAKRALAFEVLMETELTRIDELSRGTEDVLIAPAAIKKSPAYAAFQRLRCRIVIVDDGIGPIALANT
jgi:hypothetical protein